MEREGEIETSRERERENEEGRREKREEKNRNDSVVARSLRIWSILQKLSLEVAVRLSPLSIGFEASMNLSSR